MLQPWASGGARVNAWVKVSYAWEAKASALVKVTCVEEMANAWVTAICAWVMENVWDCAWVNYTSASWEMGCIFFSVRETCHALFVGCTLGAEALLLLLPPPLLSDRLLGWGSPSPSGLARHT